MGRSLEELYKEIAEGHYLTHRVLHVYDHLNKNIEDIRAYINRFKNDPIPTVRSVMFDECPDEEYNITRFMLTAQFYGDSNVRCQFGFIECASNLDGSLRVEIISQLPEGQYNWEVDYFDLLLSGFPSDQKELVSKAELQAAQEENYRKTQILVDKSRSRLDEKISKVEARIDK